jgi:hypothetical protein
MRLLDGLPSSPRGDWARYTDSPTCGFEKELIVTAPFSFWDPLGQFKDGEFNFKTLTSSDPAQLTKKLSAELVNGRLTVSGRRGAC